MFYDTSISHGSAFYGQVSIRPFFFSLVVRSRNQRRGIDFCIINTPSENPVGVPHCGGNSSFEKLLATAGRHTGCDCEHDDECKSWVICFCRSFFSTQPEKEPGKESRRKFWFCADDGGWVFMAFICFAVRNPSPLFLAWFLLLAKRKLDRGNLTVAER